MTRNELLAVLAFGTFLGASIVATVLWTVCTVLP